MAILSLLDKRKRNQEQLINEYVDSANNWLAEMIRISSLKPNMMEIKNGNRAVQLLADYEQNFGKMVALSPDHNIHCADTSNVGHESYYFSFKVERKWHYELIVNDNELSYILDVGKRREKLPAFFNQFEFRRDNIFIHHFPWDGLHVRDLEFLPEHT